MRATVSTETQQFKLQLKLVFNAAAVWLVLGVCHFVTGHYGVECGGENSVAINRNAEAEIVASVVGKAELDPILEGMGVIGEMATIFPNITNAIREHGTAAKALKVIGFPMDEFRPQDEYDEILAAI